ncbi:ankyrin repeat-containing domain protein [Lentinula boryana]|uniref:Ankyrin repeat-containing domain protein n=1 Tax=Lentinula boryana TaxID=40481 RepID=A0ABQ8QAV5_9AGAR|nr:ankyrin repeat-containing domain protein [Lentinula boryana]
MSMSIPSSEDKEEIFLSCRYGDIEEVQEYTRKFSPESLSKIRDDNGNTILHMISGNGHTDLLRYLLPLISPSLLSIPNNAGSTPLHWAALNSHLSIAKELVLFPSGPGVDLIDIKNSAGHSPLAEAELAGWQEGAKWLVEVMNLESVTEENGMEDVGDRDTVDPNQDVQVEIEDADGQIAKMTISGPING